MQGSLVPSTRQPIDRVMYQSGHAPVIGRHDEHRVGLCGGRAQGFDRTWRSAIFERFAIPRQVGEGVDMFNAMPSAELSVAIFASSRLTEAARSPTMINTLMSVTAGTVFVFE
jgi:hypothetical protein